MPGPVQPYMFESSSGDITLLFIWFQQKKLQRIPGNRIIRFRLIMTCPTLLYMFRYTASDETNVQHGNHLPSRHSHAQGNQTKFIQAPLCLCLYVSISLFLSLYFSLFLLLVYRCTITTYLDIHTLKETKPNQTKFIQAPLCLCLCLCFSLSLSCSLSLSLTLTTHHLDIHTLKETKPNQSKQYKSKPIKIHAEIVLIF